MRVLLSTLTLLLFFSPLAFGVSVGVSGGVTVEVTQALVYAQDPGGLVSCSGPDCTFCSVVTSANRIIEFVITLAIVIATIILAYAGVKLVVAQGNPSALSEAKGYFLNVLIGIVVILIAWTLIDTVMKLLLNDDSGIGFWNEIDASKCGGARDANDDYETNIETQEYELQAFDFEEYTTEEITFLQSVGTSHFDYPASSGSSNYSSGSGACGLATFSEVAPVPGEESHMLIPQRVAEYVAMREAAARDGVTIRIKEAWRSDNTQMSYWRNKGCVTNPSICSGRVARPCAAGGNGSNHGRGIAVDIVLQCGDRTYNWLKQNGGKWNFNNALSCKKDPYHWSPSGK